MRTKRENKFKVFRKIHGEIHQEYICKIGYIKSKLNKSAFIENQLDVPIDFVVTWVDDSDPVWQEEKNIYRGGYENKGNGKERYRDWNQFMIWFRAVEKYAPWVRKVWLITYGHIPTWLNENADKLEIITHREFIPKEYLPTFSSIPIELNIHRIKGLSEHFVYFNDDMYLTQPVKPDDFFKNGLPLYSAVAEPLRNYAYNGPFAHQLFSVLGQINGKFNIQECIERHPELWFSNVYGGRNRKKNKYAYKECYLNGLYFSHLPCPFRKSTMETVWKNIYPVLDETCRHRFRTPMDIMHQIFSAWDIMNGNFIPVEENHYGFKFEQISRQKEEIADALINHTYKMICINDSVDITDDNYTELKNYLDKVLGQVFYSKSQFEK